MDDLNSNYWNERYAQGQIGWDLGTASPPIASYIGQIKDKNTRILLPGCGNGHEAVLLATLGFNHVTVLDIAPLAVENLQKKLINFPHIRILCEDFFGHQAEYDLILEQTFFCAIDPSLREQYVQKMNDLLAPNGKLVGLLFANEFEKVGPPFGGNIVAYQQLFAPYFIIRTMEQCYNSVRPRQGNELFIHFEKKHILS
ncbi:methyltransferase domain-containing protein [Flectobacillus major]|uniref:methyltransferase domain-containing protein n=1 Tax=Flectobacillus major TaxID=103 RepID=UPI000424C183|nr:methyltransferase domain-containing protein [Flectobacillus major]